MSFRENILFGKVYNEDWYHKVIEACALDNDIKVRSNKICERIVEDEEVSFLIRV